jgi:hypothetical protein
VFVLIALLGPDPDYPYLALNAVQANSVQWGILVLNVRKASTAQQPLVCALPALQVNTT